jgi:excisionase family DNA binding protein
MNVEVSLPDELVLALADAVAERLERTAEPVPPWRLLTLEEAAQRLTRSTRWLRERAKRGDLPHIRLDGGALCFDEGDLREFARARRVGVADSLAGPLAGRRKDA